MENREEALTETPEIGTPVANLDLEEERTEGKAVVAMPKLIKVLEAIEKQWQRSKREWEWRKMKGGRRRLKTLARQRLGNLKIAFHWLSMGWFCDLIGPAGTSQSIFFADVEYPVGLGSWNSVVELLPFRDSSDKF